MERTQVSYEPTSQGTSEDSRTVPELVSFRDPVAPYKTSSSTTDGGTAAIGDQEERTCVIGSDYEALKRKANILEVERDEARKLIEELWMKMDFRALQFEYHKQRSQIVCEYH